MFIVGTVNSKLHSIYIARSPTYVSAYVDDKQKIIQDFVNLQTQKKTVVYELRIDYELESVLS